MDSQMDDADGLEEKDTGGGEGKGMSSEISSLFGEGADMQRQMLP